MASSSNRPTPKVAPGFVISAIPHHCAQEPHALLPTMPQLAIIVNVEPQRVYATTPPSRQGNT